MQAADDDAAGCVGVARVFAALRSELAERDACREQLTDRVRHTVGLPENGDREPRTTNVADHCHDLNRVPIGVLLVPSAEEKSASRGAGRLCNKPMLRGGAARWLAGGLVWSFGHVGQRALRVVVPALVAFALCILGVRSR